jgi:hypothetical protein
VSSGQLAEKTHGNGNHGEQHRVLALANFFATHLASKKKEGKNK